jgi:hypothetical protein
VLGNQISLFNEAEAEQNPHLFPCRRLRNGVPENRCFPAPTAPG